MKPTQKNIEFVQQTLLNWFQDNKRDFPWRQVNSSNYLLIISEILLQRTKAETVAKFLPVFVDKYPDWEKLCEAAEEELKAILKPLGLSNQRGSRLFKLTTELKKRNMEFPKSRSDVEEFSMMGQYIANAFELFILNKRMPLLDVNMARVLERLFGERKLADIRYDPYLQELSRELVNSIDAKQINWATLDFASIVCKARKPRCHSCVFRSRCSYFRISKK
jgi:A/G-specific adenine glycosylase